MNEMKVTRGLAGLAILFCALFPGCALLQPKRDNQPLAYSFAVEADLPWQNTGVLVRRGEVLHCLAEGQWSDDFGAYSAEGDPTRMHDIFPLQAPANSLILRFSTETNRVYYVGKQANIAVKRTGHVFLRRNGPLSPGVKGKIKVTLMPATDSDGDGLSDYEEIYLWGTDPHKADSNGTGFGDASLVSDLRDCYGGGILKPSQ